MLSAMSSRDSRLMRIPRWPIETPSETEMVVNSNGVPPAAATPSFAASAWGRSDSEQGVFSPCVLMTPTKGFAIAASSRPRARMNVRCDVRSRPSSVRRERLGAGERSLMVSSCAQLYQEP
jgi:hypothetical protein